MGGGNSVQQNDGAYILHAKEDPDTNLNHLVQQYFKLESLGIEPLTKVLQAEDDIRATQILQKTVKQLETGKYEARLLWKNDVYELPPSRNMAMYRLISLEKKLERNPELREVINYQIHSYRDKG